ncbi:hypothetical protein [Mumia zhuanghuii]|uniref:Uncharacterized protein n=1 Tax=Mumia zhuanghuii TaxID=2585211 RepID=A0A5C4MDX2_9ACTN|nr:hypothetical protein [Mumia zhuanghuii]TNC35589.1 hypothetical protein FHE65_26950 [Mumia zhuanghuii]
MPDQHPPHDEVTKTTPSHKDERQGRTRWHEEEPAADEGRSAGCLARGTQLQESRPDDYRRDEREKWR